MTNDPAEAKGPDKSPWYGPRLGAMSLGRIFRLADVAAYLGVTQQRVTQMRQEGKLPEPKQVDGVGPLWKRATIERWADRQWWDTRRWRKQPQTR